MVSKPQFAVEPYTEEELDKLEKTFLTSKSYAPNKAGEYLRLRDIAILRLSSLIGGRPAETLTLKWVDIDFKENEIRINPYSNKQRETKPIVLAEKAKEIILAWKSISDSFVISPFLFPSLFTFEPMTTSGYGKRLRTIAKEAGVGKIVWYTISGQPIFNKKFNSARKYFGNKVYRETGDIYYTMRALRHKNPSSCNPYIQIKELDLKEKLDQIFSTE